jgi:hypothetical protein
MMPRYKVTVVVELRQTYTVEASDISEAVSTAGDLYRQAWAKQIEANQAVLRHINAAVLVDDGVDDSQYKDR